MKLRVPLASAIDIRTRLVGSLDPGLIPALEQLIEADKAIGGGSGTDSLYRQDLAIRETLYGQNSPELISTIEGLADVYSAAGMFLAAEPLYERLLALWESVVGQDHPMIAVILDKLLVFYAREGKPAKSREALARSVSIRARFLALGLVREASDAVAENHPDRARELYNSALAALDARDPANAELIARIKQASEKIQGSR